MKSFDSTRQLVNAKKQDNANSIKMIESNRTESSPIVNLTERNVKDEPEVHVLTRERVNDEIQNHSVSLTKQLEDMSRLIRRMTTAQHPTSCPRVGNSAFQRYQVSARQKVSAVMIRQRLPTQ